MNIDWGILKYLYQKQSCLSLFLFSNFWQYDGDIFEILTMYERYLNIFISKAHCCSTIYTISVNVGVTKIGYIRNEKN